jgi:LPS-assembly protein
MPFTIRNKLAYLSVALVYAGLSGGVAAAVKIQEDNPTPVVPISVQPKSVIDQLGWVSSSASRCGGYYLEPPYDYNDELNKHHLIQYSSNGPTLFALHGTSIMTGDVTITQEGQQIIANQAKLYRDPKTNKLSAIGLNGNVHLREPNTLVVAREANIDLQAKTQSLHDILYRTSIYGKLHVKPQTLTNADLQVARQVFQLNAWGEAKSMTKDGPRVYVFKEVSYTTCPPDTSVWKLKASRIVLNKNTGRGYARNARFYIKKIPVFYAPYINFPIDARRATGLLSPVLGSSSKSGPYVGTPFYWNMAPNYDMTLTPAYLSKRGLQVTDLFRYMNEQGNGRLTLNIIPNDKQFSHLQTQLQEEFQNSTDPATIASLQHLENAGSTRGAFTWQNNLRLNDHWSSTVNYTRVSDDYYLEDFNHSLATQVTQNQLLQQADITYKSTHWDFTGRLQQYQTLHPIDQPAQFLNQYSRFPQLVLDGDYPDQRLGLDYFISNELTHFSIINNPGSPQPQPFGNRLHSQPGVSLPLNIPYLFVTPRAQVAMTQYELGDVSQNNMKNMGLALPILDLSSGLYFDRQVGFFGHKMQQTLEPQIYYLYVPYHNQNKFPIFDTTKNTLTYDQLFTYNRFSGLDRIGDANQISVGVTTRFIESSSGFERVRAGIGEIIYFANRNVTLCGINDPACPGPEILRDNKLRRSPLTGVLDYHLNDSWSLTGNTIWNTQINQMDNQSVVLQYHKDSDHLVNLGYSYVRQGDPQPSLPSGSGGNNLKQTDLSFSWPIVHNWSGIGRWTESINEGHFQNLLAGLQYDSCCWAVRAVAGRTFINLDANNVPVYNDEFYVQFALKGLGSFSPGGDPTQLLNSSVNGYNAEFGQDY